MTKRFERVRYAVRRLAELEDVFKIGEDEPQLNAGWDDIYSALESPGCAAQSEERSNKLV